MAVTATLTADIAVDAHVCGLDVSDDRIVIALRHAVHVVRGDQLEPLLAVADVVDLRAGWLLTTRALVRLDGARIEIPVTGGATASAFVPLADGFIVALDDDDVPAAAVVLRLDDRGRVVWRAPVPPPTTISGYVSEARREDGFKIKPARPWQPAQWNTRGRDLAISGDRLIAIYTEMPRSGIGICYGIDLATGAVAYTTAPAPYGELAPAREAGAFLVGVQGYGAFETRLVDRNGAIRTTWPSHGIAVPGAAVRVVEMENSTRSRMHVATLCADGRVDVGAHLPGYYTSNLVAAADGGAVFWRDDAVMYLSSDGVRLDRLLATPVHGRPFAHLCAGRVPGRIALAWSTSFEAGGAWTHDMRVLVIDLATVDAELN